MTAFQPPLKLIPHGADLLASMPRFVAGLPSGVSFEDDVWNLAPLHRSSKVRTFSVDFGKIGNPDIRLLSKIRVAELITQRRITPTAAALACSAFTLLSQVLQARSAMTLTSDDFQRASDIAHQTSRKTAARLLSDLARHCVWLNLHLGLHIVYAVPRRSAPDYGRRGSEQGRCEKLIPNEILSEILSYRIGTETSERDRFYISALAIAIATGLRISELMTLPVDCLTRDERVLLIRHFPAKNGREFARPVVPELRDVVEDAVSFIRKHTEEGRALARSQQQMRPIDWSRVFASEDSEIVSYFVRRWAKSFIEATENRLIDPRMAWYSRASRWLPIEDAYERHQGNASAIARELGISRITVPTLLAQTAASRRGEFYFGPKTAKNLKSFDTDKRIVSVMTFENKIALSAKSVDLVPKIIEEAAWCQIKQRSFDAPERDEKMEDIFRLDTSVLRDPGTGRIILNAPEALFITFKNQFSPTLRVNTDRFTILGANHLNHWLGGYTRDHKTGKDTDSVLSRFQIRDPRTGNIAKITVHNIRHWLNTAYEDGGLTQDQIAILFNRRSVAANAGYLHTSITVRAERLRQSVRDGLILGHAASAHARLAQESPEEAEIYLATATKFYNPMPHGICLLNWAAEVCPHSLSCLNCTNNRRAEPQPCEFLVIDREDPQQVTEIERANRNATAITAIMAEDGMTTSPQFAHFENVRKTTEQILEEIKG